MSASPRLFEPLQLRGVTLPNRVVVSPLCMYSAREGVAQPFHFAHLSTFARGKAGLIFAEASGVEARGRITPRCLGIWTDEQAEALKPITTFIEEMGSVPGIQLGHAGRKASTRPPFMGAAPLDASDEERGEGPWQTVGPSAIAAGENFPVPHELSADEVRGVVDAFAAAAKRSITAGFKVLEIHGAHGYLVHSFLSPLSNQRKDQYGGDINGRMRFAVEIAEAIRGTVSDDVPLFCRISAIDGRDGGWDMDDSVNLSRALAGAGVDVIDCSSGGIVGAPRFRTDDAGKPLDRSSARLPGFQVPYAERIRRETDLKSMAVGVIIDPQQAEDILESGGADLVALGREIMYNPFWPLHAAQALGADADFSMWPEQYKWAVDRRSQIAELNRAAS